MAIKVTQRQKEEKVRDGGEGEGARGGGGAYSERERAIGLTAAERSRFCGLPGCGSREASFKLSQ